MRKKNPERLPPARPAGDTFLSTVCSTIERYRMLDPGDHVVVAVSGGADSVAMLQALCALRSRFRLQLTVAHLDHGLRGEAARNDSDFVEAMARGLCLPCVRDLYDVRAEKNKHGMCLQEAARAVRYRFLNGVLKRCNADKLAMGHTMDDQAETVLIRLLRGASTRGLGGIPPMREGWIIRPLINVRRYEVELFLQKRGIPFIADTSPHEPHYLRNRVRHELLPLLAGQYNPRIVETLCTTADLARSDEAVLQAATECAMQGRATDDGGLLRIPVSLLAEQPHLAGRIVRRGIEILRGSCRGLTFAHVEAVAALARCTGSSKFIPLPGDLTARLEYGCLVISAAHAPAAGFHLLVERLPADILLPQSDIRVRIEYGATPDAALPQHAGAHATLHLSADSIVLPLVIRSWKPGDRMIPLGSSSEKKVKALFAEKKIPVRLRRCIPLLESEGRILSVGALRMAEHCRVTPGSSGVVAVTVRIPGLP